MRVTVKIFAVLFICCLVAPISASAIDASEVTEEDITTTVQTLEALGITQDIIKSNNCGSMGRTPIEECKEVPNDQDCPEGFCEIGGGGGKKKCAKWTPCSAGICGKGNSCITDTMLACPCFCYENSLWEGNERYQYCGSVSSIE